MIVKELQKFAKPYIIKPLKKLTAMAFARKPPPPMKPANYAFMNIALKIDVKGPGWQKVVAKVLNGIHGVSNFKMEDDGMVMISGTVDPKLLLKRLGKTGTRATMRHWQYGECSSNMYLPPSYNPYGYGGCDYYQGDHSNTYNPQGYGSYYPQYGADPYEHAAAYAGNGYGIAAHGGNNYGYPSYGEDGIGYSYSGYGRNAVNSHPRHGYLSYGVNAHPRFEGGNYGYGEYAGGYGGGNSNHYGHYNSSMY